MALIRTVAPTVEPVTRAQVKTHLRITLDNEDDYLDDLIVEARALTEDYIEAALLSQTWQYLIDVFPGDNSEAIKIPYPPLLSISSITYYDADNASATWSSSLYETDASSSLDMSNVLGRVRPISGEVYPVTYSRLNAITIEYTAGFGTVATAVPARIKKAVLFLVANLYSLRDGMGDKGMVLVSEPVKALLSRWRDHTYWR